MAYTNTDVKKLDNITLEMKRAALKKRVDFCEKMIKYAANSDEWVEELKIARDHLSNLS
ncbi:MAG: hypothetical protein ACI4J6_06105 [Oscillospiraceae bacterium]